MEESTPLLDDLTVAHPLFSTIITLYILLLLYSPSILLRTLFSPVLPITAALLLTLLRSGADNRPNPDRNDEIQLGDDTSPAKNEFEESFVEWNVKAPLGVIYEADEESNQSSDLDPAPAVKVRFVGCPSLSMCFPETDSDSGSSTDGDFPADWISDDDFPNQEGLIEIEVESYGAEKKGGGFEEEDNLIEIDIFTARSEVVIAGEMGDPR